MLLLSAAAGAAFTAAVDLVVAVAVTIALIVAVAVTIALIVAVAFGAVVAAKAQEVKGN